ncbi:hypothetical protein BOTBODRAFT_146728 [Botryobasidium botryosum FD-172 SS1]|uniref:Uncharacterized protein n=1 Tax=Botryobasidium botryosum (strain FD-172 SS1) TaxID=930990 RepID=A0A067MKX8_BOTB1|nr:hypothetical protein BOTBODRAFT_146728 [Botryobasidium botryosum FD-172 SS1]
MLVDPDKTLTAPPPATPPLIAPQLTAPRLTAPRFLGSRPDGSRPAPQKSLVVPATNVLVDMAHYKDVPPGLQPSSQPVDMEALKKIPPFSRLPVGLFPTCLQGPFPPVIHCGLPITDEQMKKLLRNCDYRSFVPQFDSYGVSSVAAATIGKYIMGRTSYFVDIARVLNVGGNDRILSFGDNYVLYRREKLLPTKETLQKLLELLELPATIKPKWYLSCVYYAWGDSPYPGLFC